MYQTKRIPQYRFIVGANNETGQTEPEKAQEVLKSIGVSGWSIQPSKGGWLHNGQIQTEPSFIIDILSLPSNPVTVEVAGYIKQQLERYLAQKEVLVVKTHVEVVEKEVNPPIRAFQPATEVGYRPDYKQFGILKR